jgi:hypothetical protein
VIHERRRSSSGSTIVRIAFVAILISGLSAQVGEVRRRVGLPEDWTHHHIKFSAAALRQHPEMAAHEPRAAFQLYREARAAMARSWSLHRSVSTAEHRDWSVLFGGGRISFGQFPAKWTDNPFSPVTAANCATDFVVFGLNVAGSATQANLIGLKSLYSSPTTPSPLCGTSPTFLFAYNISTIPNGRIVTSPVLSLDGTKVAFIETSTVSGTRQTIMHVVNIPTSNPGPGFPQGSSAASPVVPTGMTSLPLTVINADSRSSPWVEYATDTMYVAADDGMLYKIHPVFTGTPALAGSPWPLLIHATSQLTSPVIDDVSGNAFMGALNGRMYVVNVNTPAAVTAIPIGAPGSFNAGVRDSPIIDSTAGTVLATTSNDSTSAAVVQVGTASLTEIARARIGQGSTDLVTAVNLYGGDFDNTYFSTPATGHMIVCGTGAADTIPTIYSLNFNSAGHLTGVSSPLTALSSSATARCGPITEFFNSNIGGGTDFFFLGVTNNCLLGPRPGGCVMSLGATGSPNATAPSPGGTSGIIPDNNSPEVEASSIYFTSQGAPNTAYKVTQQGLN